MSAVGETFLCATWNVHRGRGRDGRIDATRTTKTLVRDVWRPDLDILVLTEADEEAPPYRGFLDLARVAEETGLGSAHDRPDLRWGRESHGFLGTILMLHPAIEPGERQVLDLPGQYPRGALVADLRRGRAAFRVIATHLSLSQPLRLAQMRTIGQYLRRRDPLPTLLIGDLNEWRPWLGLAFSRRVTGLDLRGPARATFPAVRPILPLDRILASGGAVVETPEVPDTQAIRATSDHCPLRARVRLPPR
ncbi:endonuclease/exonuclease/phosphatase family protein [Roseitranquillus sediminis]|uniref:endonuclease/exonuclease/phosphatase family protein n=1 Tax=Roseitranquillus sediminis TaxID=2809051 RepID=UPI001D0CCDA9|nr:endonuclease/exonuclease/phosphatase family protein [Roseitranquillus sediminis]MBM9595383.1 endonuclease [Roseitranquillus sediminis]